MIDFEKIKQNLKNVFECLPDGLVLEYQFDNGSIVWKITQKPVGFGVDDEKALMMKLNSISQQNIIINR